MAHENNQGYCPRCRRHTLHIRDAREVSHVFHLILTLVTCYLWAPVWLIFFLVNRLSETGKPFRCSLCGEPARRLAQRPEAPMLVRAEVVNAEWAPAPGLPPPRLSSPESLPSIRQSQIHRGQRRHFWAGVDAGIARAVGEENTIIIAALGGAFRVLAVAVPLAGIVAIVAASLQ